MVGVWFHGSGKAISFVIVISLLIMTVDDHALVKFHHKNKKAHSVNSPIIAESGPFLLQVRYRTATIILCTAKGTPWVPTTAVLTWRARPAFDL